MPLHWTEEGVPVGVQLVAPFGREDLLLRVAAQLERAEPWAERTPPVFAGVTSSRWRMGQIGGVLTAMATPFDADGEVDHAAAARLAAHLLEHGSDGLVVAGSTGEAATLDDDEQIGLLRGVRARGGGGHPADLRHRDQRHAPLGEPDPHAPTRPARTRCWS